MEANQKNCHHPKKHPMNKFLLIATAATLSALIVVAPAHARGGSGKSSGKSSSGSHSVRGYTRKDGTYVQPHRATNPNHTKTDNWSTKGNTNPDTGKLGTVDPNKQ
jgi:hypothetical protein